MFGILKPQCNLLDRQDRARHGSAYCNLCGLVGSRYSFKSRMLVVHDIATLWWLLEDPDASLYRPLTVGNCVRGGTARLRTKELPPLAQLLAGISAYTVGIKVADDLADENSWRIRLANRMYHQVFDQAREDLRVVGFEIEELEQALVEHAAVERRSERDLDQAAAATGRAYALVTSALAAHLPSRFTPQQAAELGDAVGRAIYVTDAIRDYEQDCGTAYNPLGVEDSLPGSKLALTLRREAVSYVAAQLGRGRDVIRCVGGGIQNGWHAIERRLLAAAGIRDKQSVTLYLGCCVPCGDGAVYVNDKDCDGCGTFCGVCCLLICCCSSGKCCH